MEQKNRRAQRAIQELDIRVEHESCIDKLELADILVDFLDYPDTKKAQDHAIANMMGNYDLFSTRSQLTLELEKNQKAIERNMICDCCGLFIHSETIPFCTPLQNINVGLGTRLYFNSILYNALIFFVASALYSVYVIITNVIACKDNNGQSCGIQGISLSYKIKKPDNYDNTLYTSSVLGIVLVSIWGIIEVIKNHHEKKIEVQLTRRFVQASQFTLMLEKFPASSLKSTYDDTLKYLQEVFNQYREKLQTDTDYKIIKINVARNLYMQRAHNKEVINELENELKEKQKVFKQWVIQRKYHNRFLSTQRQREQKYEEYLNFYIDYITKLQNSQNYVGKSDQNVMLFVTFQESRARQEIESNARPPNIMNFFNLFSHKEFPIQGIEVRKAPPPEEIKWTNIGFPYNKKLLRVFLVYGVALLCLAASLAITYGLNQAQNSNPDIWVSIVISIVITGINFAIQFFIMCLSKYLNESTQTNIQFNIAFKICLFQILNVIGVPLVALYISQRSLYGQNGLSQDIFFIALFNIAVPIGRFIDPYYILITLRNKIYAIPDYRLQKFHSQEEFNKIYQDNDFDLGYEYAYILKTSIFTSFFMSLQPIITIFAVLGLLLMFQVNKYRILYRFFKPRFYSATVNNLVNYLLNLSPMIFALGMLVFINWQKSEHFSGNFYMNWVIFIIGGFFFLFPFRFLYKCIPQPMFPALKYSDHKPILPSEYDRMNPVTKSAALDKHRSYLKELQQRHQLPQQAMLFTHSALRITADIRKSKLNANEQLRNTMRNSRISKSPQGSRIIQLKSNIHSKQIIQYDLAEKPVYNENMDSYNNFALEEGKRPTI